jgi:hypothetical protein
MNPDHEDVVRPTPRQNAVGIPGGSGGRDLTRMGHDGGFGGAVYGIHIQPSP